MPDRRRRTALRLPLSAERGSLLLRERQSTEPAESPKDESNPFAPPPAGSPDRPWHPRHGSEDDSSPGRDRNGPGDDGEREEGRAPGGGRWSSRQPGRSSGGFGGRPGNEGGSGGGQGGPDKGPGQGTGLRWDPTDPVQRRARYALLGGMWAFFFALFDFPEIALLLGALAIYWGGSSLRAKSRRTGQGGTAPTAAPSPGTPGQPGGRPQVTAAVSGLVMAVVALTIVAMTFTMQLVYRDFYTCVSDSLTKAGQMSCNTLLPEPLRGVIGVKE
ncbi:hypothetical protein E3E14_12985 [Streptomyces sp. ICN441]|uniref:Integral membrane protein n=1 Tax=Streptomyces tirandamycinicus TaxID=2174846 RepID=A0A2S1SVX0_9ACTN|nr:MULTISPECIES: hypothetical protein [Streptomyces]AWI30551.1 hypothetical protein DDW44_18525 [Streptomyces tirandamycinicus]TFE51564.1 hypothetical protein E3E14_12985 [Streptomyces sp. ICN441]